MIMRFLLHRPTTTSRSLMCMRPMMRPEASGNTQGSASAAIASCLWQCICYGQSEGALRAGAPGLRLEVQACAFHYGPAIRVSTEPDRELEGRFALRFARSMRIYTCTRSRSAAGAVISKPLMIVMHITHNPGIWWSCAGWAMHICMHAHAHMHI